MRRKLWFAVFIIGLPIAAGIMTLDLFILKLPQVLYGVLYDTDIPEPGEPMGWWMSYCRKHGTTKAAVVGVEG